MRYLVTFRPETAIRATTVVADGFRIVRSTEMAVFDRTEGPGHSLPAEMWPLRFLLRVEIDGDANQTLYPADTATVNA